MEDKKFAEGLIVKRNEKAPDFVKCNLSVKVEEFIKFLKENESKGWVNLQVKESKGGKLYAEVDTWKPEQKIEQGDPTRDEDDLPF